MKNINTIKVNFKGGIISHNDLYNILLAAGKSGLLYVRFGLRQQLLLDIEIEELDNLTAELDMLGISYELNKEEFPNIISSYPAEEVFIINTWLDANVYHEIFESFVYAPRLKINISDANQSFTPMLTGNINWVASPAEPHFWHLFIRFPKTNIVYEWKDIVHTKDLAGMSLHIEQTILQDKEKFYDNNEAGGDELYEKVSTGTFNTKPAGAPLELPPYNLPYYEGFIMPSQTKADVERPPLHIEELDLSIKDLHFSAEVFINSINSSQIFTSPSECSCPWCSINVVIIVLLVNFEFAGGAELFELSALQVFPTFFRLYGEERMNGQTTN